MSLLEAALPQRQIGLIGFNDRRCRSAAELRSVILKARAVALENAEHHRAAEAFKQRLLAELDRDRAVRRAAAGCSWITPMFGRTGTTKSGGKCAMPSFTGVRIRSGPRTGL